MLWEGKLICSKCKKTTDALYLTETDLSLARQGHGQMLCEACLRKEIPHWHIEANCDLCGEDIYFEDNAYFVDTAFVKTENGNEVENVVVCEHCLTDYFWQLYEDGDNGFVYERNGEQESVRE